jgi:hypothetical protein
VKEGRGKSPLLVAALMSNSEQGVADLHLKSLVYSAEYLDCFVGSSPRDGLENRLTRELFDGEEECFESLFANNQQLLESFYPALG